MGPFWVSPVNYCRGCGKPLLPDNAGTIDGCPCPCPRGTNHGLVPKHVCGCDECDPGRPGLPHRPQPPRGGYF